jgi:diguanylate cyclase (GGDEF)-like protein
MIIGDDEKFPTATDEHTISGGVDSSFGISPYSRLPALLVQRGPTIGDWHLFADTPEDIIVGRGDSATFQLRDASVSREHASFRVPPAGGVTVEDLGSTNGTRVNNKSIDGTVGLEDGDLVRVGDVVLRFRLMDSADVAFQRDISTQVRNARKDAITGLFSRRYLDEQLPQLVKGHRRNQQPISLLMLDLDHFKRVNDDHGHLVGDTVLAKVAEAVQGAIRGADSAVRYGGEEFCIILPGTRQREARTVAERVRQAIEAIDFSDTQGDLKVTGSLGVATLAGHEEIREWLQRADIALFTAKHDGRNRVEIAPVSITEDNAGGLRSKRLTMRQPTGVPPTPGED